MLHVSASNPFRRWPEPAFAEVVASLVSQSPDRRVILSSGPSDRLAADRIVAAARALLPAAARSQVIDFGEFDLAELRALVERSVLFIGGDTGPLHVAATTATPIVAIYGPTLPARSTPWRDPSIPSESIEIAGLPCRPCDQRVCAPGDYRCLTTIKPADVVVGGGADASVNEPLLPPDPLERAACLGLLGFAAATQVSIAATGILLTITGLLWLAIVVRNRERIEVPSMFFPLALYAVTDAGCPPRSP